VSLKCCVFLLVSLKFFLAGRSRLPYWGKDDLLALPQLRGPHIRPKLPLLSRNQAVRQLQYVTIANCYHDYRAEYNAYLLCVYAALGYVATQAVKVSIGLSVMQMLSYYPSCYCLLLSCHRWKMVYFSLCL